MKRPGAQFLTGEIKYVVGDATRPEGGGCKIIAHVCNDIGRWGKGFVVALSERWPEPEAQFKDWYSNRDEEGFALGAVQFVEVQQDIIIANMIGQHTIWNKDGVPPVRYEAIESCLEKTGDKALSLNASVHMPRIGCGLAGGKWEIVEPIIERTLTARGIDVTVYDFEAGS